MEIKTTMTTCPNGHHYDTAQHAGCPYCGSSGSAPVSSGAFPHTEAPAGTYTPAAPAGAFPPTEAPGMFSPAEQASAPVGNYSSNFIPTAPPQVSPYRSSSVNPFSVETVAGSDTLPDSKIEPVAGWLVCIEGPARGVDFRIHAGYNYIGRDSGDIHLTGDQQVSRQNHAMIAYDNSEQTYFVGPSAGRNLIKVNGKTVLNAVEIKSYDIISIGSTKLLFIALCGDQFNWNQEERND